MANDETRRNVTGLMKEAICSSVKVGDDSLVIGILEYLQSDKKIKTLTDTAELIEDAVRAKSTDWWFNLLLQVQAATMEQSSEMLNSILKWNHNNKIRKLTNKNKVMIIMSGQQARQSYKCRLQEKIRRLSEVIGGYGKVKEYSKDCDTPP